MIDFRPLARTRRGTSRPRRRRCGSWSLLATDDASVIVAASDGLKPVGRGKSFLWCRPAPIRRTSRGPPCTPPTTSDNLRVLVIGRWSAPTAPVSRPCGPPLPNASRVFVATFQRCEDELSTPAPITARVSVQTGASMPSRGAPLRSVCVTGHSQSSSDASLAVNDTVEVVDIELAGANLG